MELLKLNNLLGMLIILGFGGTAVMVISEFRAALRDQKNKHIKRDKKPW